MNDITWYSAPTVALVREWAEGGGRDSRTWYSAPLVVLVGEGGGKDSRTWYSAPIVALVGGITLLTKKKSASSGRRWIRFRMRK